MIEPTLQAQIDAANAYEALMVPALFGEWSSKVADAWHEFVEPDPLSYPLLPANEDATELR